MATIPEALALALDHHQAGRLQAAEQLYRQILQVDPAQADALHLLGVLARQVGKVQLAVEYIQAAVRLNADQAHFHCNLGNALCDLGRHAEAAACYSRALQLDPSNAQAHFSLANALCVQGQFAEAIPCYRRSLQLRPDHAAAHNNLGYALQNQGQVEEAIASYGRALQVKPDDAHAHYNLGIALQAHGQLAEAIASYQRTLQLQPDFADAYNNLGSALERLGQATEAVACFRHALQLSPDCIEAHHNLGHGLLGLGRYQEAIACLQRAVELKVDYADAHSNLGNAFSELGEIEKALACYDRAIALDPGNVLFRWNRALVLLATGDLARGWPEFEWRLELECLGLKRPFPQPRWDGADLAGRTILLYAEGGFGDALQFVRYAPLVARRGGRVLLECQPELESLLSTVPGLALTLVQEQSLPPFEVQAPLQSLPLAFSSTLGTIPAPVPYLWPDPQRLALWRAKLAGDRGRLRVGLVWAGRPKSAIRGNSACPLRYFLPLSNAPGVSFYNLQKGEAAAEARQAPGTMNLVDWTEELHDFVDTAALIANLDLVISTDTSVVHLAGALGKPVWALLLFFPDFRWLLKREGCPWYPSMRLFRQAEPGNWSELLERVARALRVLAEQIRVVHAP